MMGFTLNLVQAFECKLCKQLIDGSTVLDTGVSVKLFGAKGYSVCPLCGQPNPEQKITKRWRDKVDKYMAKIKEKYEQKIHGQINNG